MLQQTIALDFDNVKCEASLRPNSVIPYSVLPEISSSVNSIVNCITSFIEERAVRILQRNGVCSDAISNFSSALKSETEQIKEQWQFYLQDIN